MKRALLALGMLIALASTLPAAALAAAPSSNAPPGNSAIDEYMETVPGVSGDRRPQSPRDAGSPALTPARRAQLQDHGVEGRTLANVIDATAPGAPAPARSPTTAPATSSALAAGRSPVAATLAATTGSGDRSALGLLLPAIVLATLLGAVALLRSRRRSQT